MSPICTLCSSNATVPELAPGVAPHRSSATESAGARRFDPPVTIALRTGQMSLHTDWLIRGSDPNVPRAGGQWADTPRPAGERIPAPRRR